MNLLCSAASVCQGVTEASTLDLTNTEIIVVPQALLGSSSGAQLW